MSSTRPDEGDLGRVSSGAGRDDALVRHEEELRIQKRTQEIGAVRIHKHVETTPVSERVPRDVEHADVERLPVTEGDSGQIEELPDGSVSIPVFEEELVVTKRQVLRERIIVRKRVVTEHETISADLRRERVEVEVQGDAEVDGLERR